MKKQKGLVYLFIVLLLVAACIQNQIPAIKPTGIYFGQVPPDTIPELFAKGVVSTELDELNSVFSPDGKEFYFCVRNASGGVSIFQMAMNKNEEWSEPQLLPFASKYGDIDVTISPDGNTLLFSSLRPVDKSNKSNGNYDFWMADRIEDSWGEAIHLGEKINSESHDFYPIIAKSGNIYFSSQREGPGTNNIYMSEIIDGEYTEAVKLSDSINTEYREFDPYVSPDEQFLIFCSMRPGGYGSGDLYISSKNKDGSWSKARNLGDKINTSGIEFCPMVSPDGKYLFFTSARRNGRKVPDKALNYDDFRNKHLDVENGSGNIFWVDVKSVNEFNRND